MLSILHSPAEEEEAQDPATRTNININIATSTKNRFMFIYGKWRNVKTVAIVLFRAFVAIICSRIWQAGKFTDAFPYIYRYSLGRFGGNLFRIWNGQLAVCEPDVRGSH